jgi:NAD(P)-dependent dehydrogenase (short-subunit alcohol dehydrogenase family)
MPETVAGQAADAAVLRPRRDKTALVTDGGRRLEAAISRRLDRAGARLAVVRRHRSTPDAVVAGSHNDSIANDRTRFPGQIADTITLPERLDRGYG